MKIVLLRSGTTKNPLEKDDRCAGWRPRITESAGEPEFPLDFSEAASDPAKTGKPALIRRGCPLDGHGPMTDVTLVAADDQSRRGPPITPAGYGFTGCFSSATFNQSRRVRPPPFTS
jgi:hypothetical protein